mgnify:CR=1 FL=1
MILQSPFIRRIGTTLRPFRGVILGGLAGIPLGLYGVALGGLTGFLVDQTLVRGREKRLPPPVRGLVVLVRYCGSAADLPGGLLRDTIAVLIDAVLISPDRRISVPRGAWQLPVLTGEAQAAAERLRTSLDEAQTNRLCAAFRAAASDAEIDELKASEIIGWLHGADADSAPGEISHAAALLGIPGDAPVEDAKRAYRRLAAQFHPDATYELTETQQREAAEAFRRIQEAYETYVAFRAAADRKEVDT